MMVLLDGWLIMEFGERYTIRLSCKITEFTIRQVRVYRECVMKIRRVQLKQRLAFKTKETMGNKSFDLAAARLTSLE